jgi:hypothetical protein
MYITTVLRQDKPFATCIIIERHVKKIDCLCKANCFYLSDKQVLVYFTEDAENTDH